VRAKIPRPFTRDTDAGDVIVDPQGRAHGYDGRGFRAIEASGPSPPSPGEIAERSDVPAGISGDRLHDAPAQRHENVLIEGRDCAIGRTR
jgi:hypothetical protein